VVVTYIVTIPSPLPATANGTLDNAVSSPAPGGNCPGAADCGTSTPVGPSTLALVKGVSPDTGLLAGDVITYSFVVTNTGRVTVTSAHIVETQFTGHGAAPDLSGCPAVLGTLAPGAVKTCAANYIVVQADVDAGLIDNTATAHGVDPIESDIVSNRSSAQARTATPLAMTGVDSRLDLIVAALLLSTGALLVLAGRRRRS